MSDEHGKDETTRLGGRLAEIRARRRETLDVVAGRSGLTKGFLSKLERGLVSVSMGALLRLCRALEVDLSELVDGPSGRLVRGAELQRIEMGGEDLEEYLLTPHDEHRLQVLLSVIGPGGGSGDEDYQLPVDVEFLHVVDGELTILLEGEAHHLCAGDSLTFTSVPHTFHNHTSEPTKVLWAMAPAIVPLRRSTSRPAESPQEVVAPASSPSGGHAGTTRLPDQAGATNGLRRH